jgi:hypothetical protein
MEQFVRPVKIPSPISGHPVTPRLIEKDFGDKIVVEAHWIDPQSGAFIRKGTVEIRDKKVMQESVDESEVREVLLWAAGDPDYMYKLYRNYPGDVRNAGKANIGPDELEAAKYIYDRYEEISSDPDFRLHPDDDFEDIFAKIADEIEQDFSEEEERLKVEDSSDEDFDEEAVREILLMAAGDPDYLVELYTNYLKDVNMGSDELEAAKYIYDKFQEYPRNKYRDEDIAAVIADELEQEFGY